MRLPVLKSMLTVSPALVSKPLFAALLHCCIAASQNLCLLHCCIARIAFISAALATESNVRVAEPSASASSGQDDGKLFKYSEFVAVPGVPECRVMIVRSKTQQSKAGYRIDPNWYGPVTASVAYPARG